MNFSEIKLLLFVCFNIVKIGLDANDPFNGAKNIQGLTYTNVCERNENSSRQFFEL